MVLMKQDVFHPRNQHYGFKVTLSVSAPSAGLTLTDRLIEQINSIRLENHLLSERLGANGDRRLDTQTHTHVLPISRPNASLYLKYYDAM